MASTTAPLQVGGYQLVHASAFDFNANAAAIEVSLMPIAATGTHRVDGFITCTSCGVVWGVHGHLDAFATDLHDEGWRVLPGLGQQCPAHLVVAR
jgi:hypothetical protein